MKKLSDEQAFAEYLHGGSPLSRAYAELADEQPDANADETIIRSARRASRESGSKRARWFVPLSAAAIVLLSFGLVLRLTTAPVDPVLPDKTFETRHPAPAAEPRRLPAEVRNEKARAVEAAGSAKVAAGAVTIAGVENCAEIARIAAQATAGSAPAQRLDLIRCLRDAGDTVAARRE
ncbi:MAG: hypothetical protein H0W33_11925, partial [Gammaproteobacteria bacterium]|nr:hypothetical protein [Gammaproteobacteria bacterium]